MLETEAATLYGREIKILLIELGLSDPRPSILRKRLYGNTFQITGRTKKGYAIYSANELRLLRHLKEWLRGGGLWANWKIWDETH